MFWPLSLIVTFVRSYSGLISTGQALEKLGEVHEILLSTAKRSYIAQEENRALGGYEHSMPEGHETYPWQNVWIRHEQAGIPLVHLDSSIW